MNYWFFFSYAHSDQNMFLETFYKDLTSEVRTLTGAAAPDISFIDRKEIEHGATWNTTLEQALQSCRVFVPLYSPLYFGSEYCGKEFKVFLDRVQANLNPNAAGAPAPLIIPLLWIDEKTILEHLPAVINNIQYTHGTYPAEYLTEGLLQIARQGISPSGNYYNQYWTLIRRLAATIKNAGNNYNLPPLPSITSLDKVQSIFTSAAVPAAGGNPASASQGGPRYVQFIYVVGKPNELQAAQRSELKFYGPQGAADWQPYLEAYKGSAAALAKEVVAEIANDMHYEEITLSTGIVNQIDAAAAQDKIVVVVVDTWTLRLATYNQLIAPLDTHTSMNCITVVLWNGEDQETDVFKGVLRTAIEGTFTTKVNKKDPNFMPEIKSYDAFKKALSQALVQAQSDIMYTADVKKKMGFALVKPPQIMIDAKSSS